MDGKSLTPKEIKLKQLQELMPEVFSEGKVDFERLKATLGQDVNFNNERYVLNWAGKSDAFRALQTPSTKTLVPAKDESVDFDSTENLFVEGENLEVLKVLQKSYFGKVKMIYIDPPYNTGNDSFIYPDKFSESRDEYQRRVGDKDEEGYMTKDGMFKKNSRENGQYHSNWLNMIYPRLFLAKNLLRQDGVIFVSIDDNEVHNLRLMMNEIFGEENFVSEFPRITKKAGKTTDSVAKNTDYLICYAKTDNLLLNRNSFSTEGYDKIDEFEETRGKYKLSQTLDYGSIQYSPSLDYEIELNGHIFRPGGVSRDEMIERRKRNPSSDFCWRWSKGLFEFGLNNGFIEVKESTNRKRIYTKTYEKVRIGKNSEGYFIEDFDRTKSLSTLEFIENVYSNDNSRKDLSKIFEGKVFEYSKPINLIKKLSFISTNETDIILDFFAGSGSTAHAIMDLNKEDGGNRKFICVQLPEQSDEKSEAFKAGYKTIADIGKERIRRAGRKISDELQAENQKRKGQLNFDPTNEEKHIDIGFKVLKLADSNFKQWQQIEGKDANVLEEQMKLFVDPVSEKATAENMVYELLLKSGKGLNSRIEHKEHYYCININEMVLMLEKATQDIVNAILKEKPQKVIALDRLFKGNDQLKTNTSLQMKDAGIEFKTI